MFTRNGENLFDKKQEQRALELAARADHVFVMTHGGKTTFPLFDALMEAVGGRIFILPSGEEEPGLSREFSSDFGSGRFNQWVKYKKAAVRITGTTL